MRYLWTTIDVVAPRSPSLLRPLLGLPEVPVVKGRGGCQYRKMRMMMISANRPCTCLEVEEMNELSFLNR
jgi:hypothetical protein